MRAVGGNEDQKKEAKFRKTIIKMRKIHEFRNCTEVLFNDNVFYCGVGKKIVIWDFDLKSEKIIELEEVPRFIECVFNNVLLLDTNRRQILTKNALFINEALCIKIDDVRISQVKGKKLQFYTKGKDSIVGIFDLEQNRILFKNETYKGKLYESELSLYLYDEIISYNTDNGDEIWRLPLDMVTNETKNNTARKYLGLNKGKIYVALLKGLILEIDYETGELKNCWKDFDKKYHSYTTLNTAKPIKIYSESISSFNKSILIPELNKIVGFEYGVYWEIDLDTKELEVKSMADHFLNHDISGCWSSLVYEKNRLYFFSDQSVSSKHNHKLISFDLENKIVISDWQLPKKGRMRRGFNIWGPKLGGSNYLAALEQNGTCHLMNLK